MKKTKIINVVCAAIYMLLCAYTAICCIFPDSTGILYSLGFVGLGGIAAVTLALFVPRKKSHSIILIFSLLLQYVYYYIWINSIIIGDYSRAFPKLLIIITSILTIAFIGFTAFSKNGYTTKALPEEACEACEKTPLGKVVKIITALCYIVLCLYTICVCLNKINSPIIDYLTHICRFPYLTEYLEGDGAMVYTVFLLPNGLAACITFALFSRKNKKLFITMLCSLITQLAPIAILLGVGEFLLPIIFLILSIAATAFTVYLIPTRAEV